MATISLPILAWAWTEKKRNENDKKETKHIHNSVANLLHIWI